MAYPRQRPRRLRSTPALRRLVAQTSLEPRHLVLPMFVADGIDEPRPIPSMPGVVQHTRDSLRSAAADAVAAGVGGLMLFGVPREQDKDAAGSAGTDPDGILNVALRDLAKDLGDATVLMADTCLDEFTDHGHCGVLDERGRVDNDATLAAVRGTGCGASGIGCSRGRAQRDDGRPGGRDSRRPGCRGPQRRGDPGLRREVRLGVLRPVPRGGELEPVRRPAHLPAGAGQHPGGAARGRTGPRRGRRHRDGQTRDGLPRCT